MKTKWQHWPMSPIQITRPSQKIKVSTPMERGEEGAENNVSVITTC